MRGPSGWGFDGVAGFIDQVEDDSGALADRVGGFQGCSFGVGPIVTFSKKWQGGEHVDVALRYIKEFSVKNRFEGNPMMLSVAFGF